MLEKVNRILLWPKSLILSIGFLLSQKDRLQWTPRLLVTLQLSKTLVSVLKTKNYTSDPHVTSITRADRLSTLTEMEWERSTLEIEISVCRGIKIYWYEFNRKTINQMSCSWLLSGWFRDIHSKKTPCICWYSWMKISMTIYC